MKLKTRIIVGFGMSILVPLLLFSATLYGLGHTKFAHQTKDSSEVVYDISVGESTHSQTQVRIIAKDLLFTATVILVFTALSIGLWIYRSIATPLVKLKKATQNIKEGNLDFVLEVDGNDEFSELCRDFEEMRKRLKESAEEKVLMDKENKELISNISHDLKTPITAVKGYVEGIMDGVADTPEKIDRYVKTIYNKTNEMDHLINELTFYSKIDTNRIPYTFSKLNVEDYFSDCAEEVGLELRLRTHIIALYDTGNPQIGAEAFRKTSVLVCRCSAQTMVDMYRGEGIPCKFLLQAMQNVEQCNGIRSTRKPNHKPCALRHHLKLSQCVSYLFPHVRLLLGILFFPENSSCPLLYTIAKKKTTPLSLNLCLLLPESSGKNGHIVPPAVPALLFCLLQNIFRRVLRV